MEHGVVANEYFLLRHGPGGICSLKRSRDIFDTDYIQEGQVLGPLGVWFRTTGETWRYTDLIHCSRNDTPGEPDSPLAVSSVFSLEANALIWQIQLRNFSPEPVEVGGLAVPLPFNTRYVRDPQATYTKRLVKHCFMAGSASFIFWMRANGIGPYLAMTPLGRTRLEYFDVDWSQSCPGRWEGPFTVYIHSHHLGAAPAVDTWRQPRTSLRLSPAGDAADAAAYGFRFRWAEDYDAVRELLYQEGLLDIHVAPGMVVPQDLTVRLGLRTKRAVTLVPEYPEQTTVAPVDEVSNGTSLYEVSFRNLGENLLTVQDAQEFQATLEFFVTEPVETLIKKRSAFIARKQQHREPYTWYNGLFSLWDMAESVLRGPQNPGRLKPYMVGGSDDPCLSKALFLAEKNIVFPAEEEIAALDYYLREFVWGRLQRTAQELPRPYGVYGSPNWYANRNSPIGLDSGGLGQEHMWRTFDYPHLIRLYLNMHRIATLYPDLTCLAQTEYLERAYGTAQAFFTVPYRIRMGEPWSFHGWCDWAYKQGNFNERSLLDLIVALEDAGRREQAAWLRGEWEKKVTYFLHHHPYPFGSEMYFDSTAFESTHAIAKYALERSLPPTERLWYDKNLRRWYSRPATSQQQARLFMERQIAANVACRGWLEASYYHLGSDYRAGGSSSYALSYMSQLGGWAILDYALYHTKEPAPYLRLGYASLLSSWCLLNSGTAETDYGYWYPGQENDGAAAWGFEPALLAHTWAGEWQSRGAWPYDGEIDHGFAAAVATAATVVIQDPLLGLYAYGALLSRDQHSLSVTPRDGTRQRLHVLLSDQHLEISLNRDGFAAGKPLVLHRNLAEISMYVESRYSNPHTVQLRLRGLPPGEHHLMIDGARVPTVASTPHKEWVVEFPMADAERRLRLQICRP